MPRHELGDLAPLNEAGNEATVAKAQECAMAFVSALFRNVNVDRHGTRKVAEAYLQYLHTPAGQESVARELKLAVEQRVFVRPHGANVFLEDCAICVARAPDGGHLRVIKNQAFSPLITQFLIIPIGNVLSVLLVHSAKVVESVRGFAERPAGLRRCGLRPCGLSGRAER